MADEQGGVPILDAMAAAVRELFGSGKPIWGKPVQIVRTKTAPVAKPPSIAERLAALGLKAALEWITAVEGQADPEPDLVFSRTGKGDYQPVTQVKFYEAPAPEMSGEQGLFIELGPSVLLKASRWLDFEEAILRARH